MTKAGAAAQARYRAKLAEAGKLKELRAKHRAAYRAKVVAGHKSDAFSAENYTRRVVPLHKREYFLQTCQTPPPTFAIGDICWFFNKTGGTWQEVRITRTGSVHQVSRYYEFVLGDVTHVVTSQWLRSEPVL